MSADSDIENTIMALGALRRWANRTGLANEGTMSTSRMCLSVGCGEIERWERLAPIFHAEGAERCDFTYIDDDAVEWRHWRLRVDFGAGVHAVLVVAAPTETLDFGADYGHATTVGSL